MQQAAGSTPHAARNATRSVQQNICVGHGGGTDLDPIARQDLALR